MSRFLVIILFILQIAIIVQCSGIYSIIAPGILRSKSNYHVTVSIHDARSPCKIKVGLTGPEFDKSETIEIPPKSSKTLTFQIPKLERGDYNLTAEGLSGIEFKNTTKLNCYAPDKFIIYIQTDKATYKPNDKVQYRVLVMDKNTRPAKLEGPANITIKDADQNLIKKLNNIELTKGVFSGELQLSEFPIFGSWRITINADDTTKTKIFDVDKYVLPKFEVQLDAPKDVAFSDRKFPVTIRSKYTYGKPMKGKAIVSAKISDGNDYVFSNAEKTIQIDGKGHVEFDITQDLKLNEDSYVTAINITASVEEELTGIIRDSIKTVKYHQSKYKVQGINPPDTYSKGKPVKIDIVVKNLDGSPVQDIKNPVVLNVSPPALEFKVPITFYNSHTNADALTITVPPPPESKNYTSMLDKNGMAKFEFVLPDFGSSYTFVKASYLDSTSHVTTFSNFEKLPQPVDESLRIIVQTENPALGKDVSIRVQNGKPISYFIYTVVGRGDILQSGIIDVPQNRNYHVFKITPTFEMIPRATIFIHYVIGTDLFFTETIIKFEEKFENSISIEAPVEAKPGAEMQIKVSTNRNSYVGLLGVDQSVLLLKSGNDLKKNAIFVDMGDYDTRTPYIFGFQHLPGFLAGVVTMSNANDPFSERLKSSVFGQGSYQGSNGETVQVVTGNNPGHNAPVVRKFFPETWIFDDIKNTKGRATRFNTKVPDTITSWIITGFSLNPQSGLAITEEATKLRVFQPFFISTNLPYSVKRGEVISIPVVVFNYLDKDLDAEVTLDNSDREFDFTEATNTYTDISIEDVNSTKSVSIPSNSGKMVSFMIRPNIVGALTLKISAISPIAGDAIQQSLKVEPGGMLTYVNKAIHLKLNEEKEKKVKVDIQIPANSVKNSAYVELSVVGDLLGPTIKNLDKLIRMPYGCGEQNMMNFVPNILVLQYLTVIKQLTPELEDKAKNFLSIGYQRELQYKHGDGSYSAFGYRDKSGSTWLTAYVMKSFHQAIPYTDIDPKIIKDGLKFLACTQLPSGEFPEVGLVFDSSHNGGSIGLSAYVLLAFLENVESVNEYKDAIEKGLKFLEKELESTKDQYSLAIAGLALLLGERKESAKKIFTKLDGVVKEDGDHKWWTSQVSNSLDIEMTAYIVLAKLKMETAESALPCFRWLLSKRNSNGGFTSTQDTVIGLEALSKFAEKGGIINVDFNAGQNYSGSIKVTPENSLTLQTHVLPNTVREIEIKGSGSGSSLVHVSYQYNMFSDNNKPRFIVSPIVQESPKDQLRLVVCTQFIPLDDETESNMALMEVVLPSGYTAHVASFDKIKSVESVKRVDTKNSDSMIIIYFDRLLPQEICVPIEAFKSHAVAKQRPSPVTVYDYYDNEKRCTEYYEVNSSLCDICDGEDCGTGCTKKN